MKRILIITLFTFACLMLSGCGVTAKSTGDITEFNNEYQALGIVESCQLTGVNAPTGASLNITNDQHDDKYSTSTVVINTVNITDLTYLVNSNHQDKIQEISYNIYHYNFHTHSEISYDGKVTLLGSSFAIPIPQDFKSSDITDYWIEFSITYSNHAGDVEKNLNFTEISIQ